MIVLIAKSKAILQKFLDVVTEESTRKGLALKAFKTDAVAISKKDTGPTIQSTK